MVIEWCMYVSRRAQNKSTMLSPSFSTVAATCDPATLERELATRAALYDEQLRAVLAPPPAHGEATAAAGPDEPCCCRGGRMPDECCIAGLRRELANRRMALAQLRVDSSAASRSESVASSSSRLAYPSPQRSVAVRQNHERVAFEADGVAPVSARVSELDAELRWWQNQLTTARQDLRDAQRAAAARRAAQASSARRAASNCASSDASRQLAAPPAPTAHSERLSGATAPRDYTPQALPPAPAVPEGLVGGLAQLEHESRTAALRKELEAERARTAALREELQRATGMVQTAAAREARRSLQRR